MASKQIIIDHPRNKDGLDHKTVCHMFSSADEDYQREISRLRERLEQAHSALDAYARKIKDLEDGREIPKIRC